jgi:hypothetical protein
MFCNNCDETILDFSDSSPGHYDLGLYVNTEPNDTVVVYSVRFQAEIHRCYRQDGQIVASMDELDVGQ